MIVIAYKKDYSTSCRGCTMERYGSDFQMRHFVNEDEAIEWLIGIDSQTRFEQDQGKDAWDFYIIEDGFEQRIKDAQYYNPDIDGEWKSQGDAAVFCDLSAEQKARIKIGSDETYAMLVQGAKDQRTIDEKKRKDEDLARKVADAKKLLQQHPEQFTK